MQMQAFTHWVKDFFISHKKGQMMLMCSPESFKQIKQERHMHQHPEQKTELKRPAFLAKSGSRGGKKVFPYFNIQVFVVRTIS